MCVHHLTQSVIFSWYILKTRSRPVVRFCDISKYVEDTDRQDGSMKTSISHPASSSTKKLLAEPTEEAGENKELDRLWEDGDDDDSDDEGKEKSCPEVCQQDRQAALPWM